ncbi:MAG: hypothetical protein JG718_15420 [Candidatus Thiothrix moscowensis]|nr:hypothetical protein [Candidatus Thiothrix moscowensis]
MGELLFVGDIAAQHSALGVRVAIFLRLWHDQQTGAGCGRVGSCNTIQPVA